MPKITFRTHSQAAIFEHELLGQFSDGMWENAQPYDHWKSWCLDNLEVWVGGSIGRNFGVIKDGYRLTALIPIIGERMRVIAKLGTIGFPNKLIPLVESYIDSKGTTYAPKYEGEYADQVNAALKLFNDDYKEQFQAENYTEKQLRQDLKEIKRAMKIDLRFASEGA